MYPVRDRQYGEVRIGVCLVLWTRAPVSLTDGLGVNNAADCPVRQMTRAVGSVSCSQDGWDA
jgi:hypothetical protein